MGIEYKTNVLITMDEYIQLLLSSGLSERRPIENRECMKGALQNSNLIVSAWKKDKLIGIARSITDFHYACYLSDLAVDRNFQRLGIGKKLLAITQKEIGTTCKLILFAAPSANSYYKHLGFTNNSNGWVIDSKK